ncbi:major facilitator superfamily transporter [Fusarium beomiforme]|uniref:Major facilitator superfamily transporter n=1 Tax=Fusarium beomiforme TaxID=44412 RepID=A0A9P5DUJ5_9HYPO|nr:major facilitator superfamily transporter [Fusarium beomiforme]
MHKPASSDIRTDSDDRELAMSNSASELNKRDKPVNWSRFKKWAIVVSTSLAAFVVSFGSSVYSAAIPQIQDKFSVSRTTALLGVTLYVLGFAFGPMVWGPASELYGKRRPLFLGYIIFCLCQVPCALAKDLGLLLTFRFLSGLAGSSTLAILGGMYIDFLTDPAERGISTAVFSVATFCGPTIGPILGNLVSTKLGWRWTAWLTLIGGVLFGTVAFLLTPETSEVVILRRKARQGIRRSPSLGNIPSQTESSASVFIQKYLTKPIRMFVREPILIFFTIYMSFAYAIIYITLTMYPLAFVTSRGWSPIDGSLPFIGIVVGVIMACIVIALHSIYYVSRKLQETGVHSPEGRLPPMIAGSAILSGGIFWFSWTSNPSIPWLAQVPAGVLLGCGSILVLMSGVVYLIEVYLVHANSALAINNLVRCVVAATFPLYVTDLLDHAGLDIGGSVLGSICLFLSPVAFLFWRFGHAIRRTSKFAQD